MFDPHRKNLRYAQASMTVANAGLFPTLDGNYRASRSHSRPWLQCLFSIGLNVSWTIDAGGRFASSEAAFSDYLSSQASLGDVQTRIALKWPAPHVNMRLAQKRLDVAQKNAKTSAGSTGYRQLALLYPDSCHRPTSIRRALPLSSRPCLDSRVSRSGSCSTAI